MMLDMLHNIHKVCHNILYTVNVVTACMCGERQIFNVHSCVHFAYLLLVLNMLIQ